MSTVEKMGNTNKKSMFIGQFYSKSKMTETQAINSVL